MKRKILIASFLKPVNDIRSFEKMAVSIAKNNRNDVYATGYPASLSKDNQNVTLLPLKPFKRNGIGRLWARLEIWKLYLKLKPELIIVNSPDLLLVTSLYKILFGGKIIYDIRENYKRNLWYQTNYPGGIRHLLAVAIRVTELVASPFFNHFFLAEKVYAKQLSFIKRRFTIIENKSLKPTNEVVKRDSVNSPTFLISGTIAREYGVFEGIGFFKQIEKKTDSARLIIIGHCANKKTLESLRQYTKNDESIELIISKTPLPHSEIEEAILQSDFGLLPYLPNKSTAGKWPTKLFEYMAYNLPIIIQTSPTWDSFITKNKAGFTLDFMNVSILSGSLTIQNLYTPYYTKKPSGIFWVSEERKLMETLDTIFKN